MLVYEFMVFLVEGVSGQYLEESVLSFPLVSFKKLVDIIERHFNHFPSVETMPAD